MSEKVKPWTKGPWYPGHISDDTSTCQCRTIITENAYLGGIAEVYVDNGISSISEGGNDCPPLEEAKANARLIAASPDLVEALEVLIDMIETSEIVKNNAGILPFEVDCAKSLLARIYGT